MKRLVFTVTNDLTFDQRMIRICTSLANAGYHVLLVGRKMKDSVPLKKMTFDQKRLHCFFSKGKLFYAEFNLRLFIYLLLTRFDLVCAIDLDTILPSLWVSVIRRKKRVYDAHELFCEMKEIVQRPAIYRIWKTIEKKTVPSFDLGYTVNEPIAKEFRKMYDREYGVIMNAPVLRPLAIPEKKEKYILYQGAVNEGRSFETLIPAMKVRVTPELMTPSLPCVPSRIVCDSPAKPELAISTLSLPVMRLPANAPIAVLSRPSVLSNNAW